MKAAREDEATSVLPALLEDSGAAERSAPDIGNSEHRQVTLAKARRLGDDVDLNNLCVGDREAEYSGQLAIWPKLFVVTSDETGGHRLRASFSR